MVKKLDLIVRDLPEFNGILATLTDGIYEYSNVFGSKSAMKAKMKYFVDKGTRAIERKASKQEIKKVSTHLTIE